MKAKVGIYSDASQGISPRLNNIKNKTITNWVNKQWRNNVHT